MSTGKDVFVSLSTGSGKAFQCYLSSGSADLDLFLTASQVFESKVDKGKIPLWHRCLKVSTTSKA